MVDPRRAPGIPPSRPDFFTFMQFGGKLGKITGWRPRRHLCAWCTLLWEILDPPLVALDFTEIYPEMHSTKTLIEEHPAFVLRGDDTSASPLTFNMCIFCTRPKWIFDHPHPISGHDSLLFLLNFKWIGYTDLFYVTGWILRSNRQSIELEYSMADRRNGIFAGINIRKPTFHQRSIICCLLWPWRLTQHNSTGN